MDAVTKGRGVDAPHRLIEHALGAVDRMAEGMWHDEALRRTNKPRPIAWADENTAEREVWTRRATAGLLSLLFPD